MGARCIFYGWIMEKRQPIGIDCQLIRDDVYIEGIITQHYMEFDEDHRGQDFGITLSLNPSLLKMASIIVLLTKTRGRVLETLM